MKPYDIECSESVREQLLGDLGFRNYYGKFVKFIVNNKLGPYYYFQGKPYFVGRYAALDREIRTLEALKKLSKHF